MKKTLTFFASIVLSLVMVQTVFAQYGTEATAERAGLNTTGTVAGTIGNVIGNILTMVGVLFLVLMIYGGITWMMARGNEDQTKKALNTITAAVIGLIIVMASYAVTNFVFQSVDGNSSGGLSCKYTGTAGLDCTAYPSCGAISVESVCNETSGCCGWR